MAGQINPSPLGSVGAYGMNTQASPIDLPPQFATLAINCFADEAGRPTARKSMALASSANAELASAPIERCYRHNSSAGVGTMVLAGAGCIYTSTDGATLTTRDSTGYLTDTWQFASLNGLVIGCGDAAATRVVNEARARGLLVNVAGGIGVRVGPPSRSTAPIIRCNSTRSPGDAWPRESRSGW